MEGKCRLNNKAYFTKKKQSMLQYIQYVCSQMCSLLVIFISMFLALSWADDQNQAVPTSKFHSQDWWCKRHTNPPHTKTQWHVTVQQQPHSGHCACVRVCRERTKGRRGKNDVCKGGEGDKRNTLVVLFISQTLSNTSHRGSHDQSKPTQKNSQALTGSILAHNASVVPQDRQPQS